jgi:hypothetical protein
MAIVNPLKKVAMLADEQAVKSAPSVDEIGRGP